MNELQKLAALLKIEMAPHTGALIVSIIKNLKAEKTISQSVNIAFDDTNYLQHMEDSAVRGSISASQIGLKPAQLTLDLKLSKNYFLFTKFDNGVSLSDTIHNGTSQKEIKAILKDYFKFRGNVQDLTKNISKATTQQQLSKTVSSVITEYNKGEIKSQLGTASLNKLKRLEKSLKQDKKGLANAYKKLIKEVEAGSDIEKTVSLIVKRKQAYVNERIARTEMARSYDMSFNRSADELGATGSLWVLSASHPREDICDVYAEVDSYNMGAGVSPVGVGVAVPAHANCLCSRTLVYVPKGRYSEARVIGYMDGLSDSKRARIIGVEASKQKKNYINGVQKKGYNPNESKARMISKSVINEL